MADIQRVPLGRPPAGSWLPGVAAAFAILLALAVVKPWAAVPPILVAPTAGPTFYIAPEATDRAGSRGYDPRLFGGREPDPAWELWPAGYVVQFGMAGPVKVDDKGAPSPDPAGSGAPPGASAATPGASPAASGDSGAGGSPPAGTAPPPEASLPPGVVDLGPSNHLVALGINTPLDARVAEVTLWLYGGEGDCCPERVEIVRLPTLWESEHFIVIAPAAPGEPGMAGEWLVGRYRLDVTTTRGELRQVTFRVRPPMS